MRFQVLSGDITHTPFQVEAIATCVNSGRLWSGGVDMAIQRCTRHYHAELARNMPREPFDGTVYIVPRGNVTHNGNFSDVMFIVDDFNYGVGTLVAHLLSVAAAHRVSSLAMPVFRTGVALFASGESERSTILGMLDAIRQVKHTALWPHRLYIVTYNNPEQFRFLVENSVDLCS